MRTLALSVGRWLLFLSLLVLQACGGGGGGGSDAGDDGTGTEPQTQIQAIVDMTLTGHSASVGSVYLELQLPEGFAPATAAGGVLAAGVLSTDLPAAYLEAVYLPESATSAGLLRLGLICARGFTAERFTTLLADMDGGGTPPRAEEFRVVTLTVADLQGRRIPDCDIVFSVQAQETAP